jgi:hypothetical protein
MTCVEYVIDELVLIGFNTHDARTIADGIEQRLLAELLPLPGRAGHPASQVDSAALPGETPGHRDRSWVTELSGHLSNAARGARPARNGHVR